MAAEVVDDEFAELFKACKVGNVKWLGEFVINGGNLSSATDKFGKNALHYCVKCVDQTEPDNSFSIHEGSDRFRCARILIKVTPQLLQQYDHDGLTPLHHTVLNDDIDLLHALLEFHPDLGRCTTEPLTKDADNSMQMSTIAVTGRTVFHLSVIRSNPDTLKLLLLQKTAVEHINTKDFQGATALHYAVQLPSPTSEHVIALISRIPGVDFNVTDKHERTPTVWAATIGAAQALKELLKHGAKLNIKDENGLSALHCASSRGNITVIETILAWIVLVNSDEPHRLTTFINILDKDGCSPLFYSVTVGHKDVTKALLDAGADVNIKDGKGRTVAHCLARLTIDRRSDVEGSIFAQLNELLNKGLNPWQPNASGITPLHEACILRNSAFIVALSCLPNFDNWVNYRNPQSHTTLHLVVATSWSQDPRGLQIVECILKHSGEVNATTLLPGGKAVTPLDLAIMNEKEENVKLGMMNQLLVRYGGKTFDEMRQISKPSNSLNNSFAMENVNDHEEGELNKTSREVERPTDLTPKKQCRHTESLTVDRQLSNVVVKSSRHTSTSEHRMKNVGVSVNTSQQNKTCQSVLSYRTVSVQCESPQRQCIQISKETPSCVNSTPEVVEINLTSDFKQPRHEKARSHLPNHAKSRGTANLSLLNRFHSSTMLTNNEDSWKEIQYKPVNKKDSRKQGKGKTKAHVKHNTKPCPDIQIEKELPVALQRFLSKRDESISLMTGRRRMPKPMQSPYLAPVVPDILLITTPCTNAHQPTCMGRRKIRGAIAIHPHDNFSTRTSNHKSRSTHRPPNPARSPRVSAHGIDRYNEVCIHSLRTNSHPCSAMGGELTPDIKDYQADAPGGTNRSDRKKSGQRVIKWDNHAPTA